MDSRADGETPLCRAARKGRLDIVKLLIQRGAPVDARARNGSTPLMFAAAAGQPEAIDQLCLLGADPDAVNPSIKSTGALFFAAAAGQLDACKRLASHNAKLMVKNSEGATCLIGAASEGHTAVVNWLLDQGVAIDEPDKFGNTALIRACAEGHLEVAKVLAIRKANLAAKNSGGVTCLIGAADRGHTTVVNWLLDQRVAIDEPDNSGNTALIRACMMGHLEVAQLLVERNANLAAKDGRGMTCLIWAAARGRTTVVKWLLEQDVPIDEPDKSGHTALIAACLAGDLEVAKAFAIRNANLAAKNGQGMTCLIWAAVKGHKEVVNWLLANGASPDEPNNHQQTPLYYAVKNKHWHVANLLLEYDVNLLLNSDDGTVLGDAIARRAASDRHYQILLQLFSKDINKYRSFDYAVSAVESAAIRDLANIFEASRGEERLFPENWLSDAKKSDRQAFSLRCTSDSQRRELLTTRDSLLSHLINAHLELDLGDRNVNLLSSVLVGEGKEAQPAQKRNIILFKLIELKNSSVLNEAFSGKQLTAEQEAHINAVLAHKLDAMILACQESLHLEQADNFVYLKNLCQRYLDIQGNFRAEAFSKALCKHLGLYQVNADRLAALAVRAWKVACSKPLGSLPSETAEHVFIASGQQFMDNWFTELKNQLIQSAGDSQSSPGFSDGFMRLAQATQDQGQQRQQAQQQLPQPDLHELYAELIFGQWHKVNAALGMDLSTTL